MSSVSLVITAGEMTEPLSWHTHNGVAAAYSVRCPTRAEGENEDSALLIEPRPGSIVAAVADGAGGHASGAHASRIAVSALATALQDADRTVAEERTSESNTHSIVWGAMEKANEEICALGTGAATTLTVALIENQTIRTFQVGDSKVLVTGQRGRLRYRTIAHSPIGYAIEAGMMGEKEAISHEDLHVVSNMAGTPEMHIEIGPLVKLQQRDTIILGSDGLFDNAYHEEIIERARVGPLEKAASRIAQLARQRMINPSQTEPSKPDDLTFILLRLAGAPASTHESYDPPGGQGDAHETTPTTPD